MSVTKRPNSPFYYADFTVKGERVFRSTGATSRREAEAIERQWKADKRKEIEGRGPSSRLTLDGAFGKFWREKKTDWAPAWQAEVARYIKDILSHVNPSLDIECVTDNDVNTYVQICSESGIGGYSINRALAVWSGMHNRARKTWKCRVHEIDWAAFKRSEEKRTQFFTFEQVTILLSHLPIRTGLSVEWSVYTGCRKTETFGLKWEAVFFDRGYAEVIAKGGKTHRVWLTPQALDVLSRCDTSTEFVFDKTNARRAWAAALKKAGIKDFRWHDLRHTHATWLRQNGAPVEVVQRSLGHADVATTMRYAHVADAELVEALHKLPQLSTSGTHVTQNISSFFVGKQRLKK